MATESVKPSAAALRDALALSDELLRNIELAEIPLTNAALRAARLARLVNDFTHQKIFEYEAGGYPSSPNGLAAETWRLAEAAERTYQKKDDKGVVKSYSSIESIEQLEAQVEGAKLGLDAARDPNVSSANPNQHTWGNGMERLRLHGELKDAVKRLGSRRSFLYGYVVQRNLELKFSGIASDAFSRIREAVDQSVGQSVPAAVQKFAAIYENLSSENPEDWSNAVHGCRRVLQDLADALFPATDTPREKTIGQRKVQIQLGTDNYINRLACFAEDAGTSERTTAIIGSQLNYLGDRLDALFQAAQKGSHSVIASREEADRYVVYTYMIVGDMLKLKAARAS